MSDLFKKADALHPGVTAGYKNGVVIFNTQGFEVARGSTIDAALKDAIEFFSDPEGVRAEREELKARAKERSADPPSADPPSAA